MADYSGGIGGGYGSLISRVTTNSQNAGAGSHGQSSIRFQTIVQRTGSGGTLFSGGASWSSNYGGNNRSAGFSYSLGNNASLVLDDYSQTFNHDANGNLVIGGGASVNMNNSPYMTTGSTGISYNPGRLARAPTNSTPTSSNISVVTARITASVSSWGNGSAHSTPYNIRYRKQGDATWIERGWGAANWDLTGLIPGTAYEFQTRARNNNGDTSAYTSSQQFTTLPAPSTSATLLGITGVL